MPGLKQPGWYWDPLKNQMGYLILKGVWYFRVFSDVTSHVGIDDIELTPAIWERLVSISSLLALASLRERQ